MPALHDFIQVLESLGVAGVMMEMFLPARYRRTAWTIIFVWGGATSTVHLLSPNPVWAMYHLCWVVIGVAVGAHWWQAGHHLAEAERPRRESNPGPSA